MTSIDPTAIHVLRATPALLRSLFHGAPQAAIEAADAGEWPARTVLAHLVDVEDGVLSARVRRLLEEERPFIASIDAPARIAASGLDGWNAETLLEEIEGRRAVNVAALVALGADELARAGEHDTAGEITVSDIIHQWAYHDLMHVKQAASALQAGLLASMGNTRRFYDV